MTPSRLVSNQTLPAVLIAKPLPVIVIAAPGTPEVGFKVRVWPWANDGATKTRLIISITTTRAGKNL
jgi:hypothetical protein